MMPYTVHTAVVLSVSLGFYHLLLARSTYYALNRIVLLTCLAAAFLLPLVPVPATYALMMPVADHLYSGPVSDTRINLANGLSWLGWVYWFGVAAFGVNYIVQIASLVYQSLKSESIRDGRYRIAELSTDKAPCSFGNYIFLNPAKYDWDTYSRILLHEKIHVRGYHSIDLALCELMLVFQWFNPLAWLYRKTVENNLEFLTDDAMLREHQVDAQAYQWSLLQVSVPNHAVRLATNYNQSLLKKRVMMMDTKRSDVHSLWKYAMLVPVWALLVCGLNQPRALTQQQQPQQTPGTYPKAYPKAPGYSAAEQKKLLYNDSVQTVRITKDMIADHLIEAGAPLSFELSDNSFRINNIVQPDAVFKRYHQKYAPVLSKGPNWVWSHHIGQ